LIQEELPHLMRLVAPDARDEVLEDLLARAASRGLEPLKHVVFAALSAGLGGRAPLCEPLERVFARDPTLKAMRGGEPAPGDVSRMAAEIGALLAHADRYHCGECGFAGRHFYWLCPACHAWDGFAPYTIVKLG